MNARAIVTLVQTFYDQTQPLQAAFEQTRYTRLYDRYDRASGTVVFRISERLPRKFVAARPVALMKKL